jgi:hypothetical protein
VLQSHLLETRAKLKPSTRDQAKQNAATPEFLAKRNSLRAVPQDAFMIHEKT